MKIKALVILMAVSLLALISNETVGARAPTPPSSSSTVGLSALSGGEAANYTVPDDMELVRTIPLARYGLTYERYQQFYGGLPAQVLGGQISVYRSDASHEITLVIGAHYPNITVTNSVTVSEGDAEGITERDLGPSNVWSGDGSNNSLTPPPNLQLDGVSGTTPAKPRSSVLMIDPHTGRYFYRVESPGIASRWFHWVDAETSEVLNKYDATTDLCESASAPCGFGVEYSNTTTDVKDLTGLTLFDSSTSEFLLASPQSACGTGPAFFRQQTFDAGSVDPASSILLATDADDEWTQLSDVSPSQQALVDTQYYAKVTDDYFCQVHGFDWVGVGNSDPDHGVTAMLAVAHYLSGLNNAFWNGFAVWFGDGDQVIFEELTTLDIVSHELAHGMTDFTSNLIYQNESGALNESISDIMAANIEFFADANGLEPATTLGPDFLVGEDVVLQPDAAPGIRNMQDPEEDGHPDYYTERFTGTGDNGGVHINSGLPNHAYYLLVNGGMNASCVNPSTHNSAHCSDGGDTQDNNLSVTGIGLSDAEQIFFLGFAALPENATMCDGRAATETAADTLFGSGSQQSQSTADAWVAVGLTDLECGVLPEIFCNGKQVTMLGTSGPDTLIGTSGDDVIRAGDGNDFIDSQGGNDTICAEGGNDFVLAGAGRDWVSGGPGNDIIDGGDGSDRRLDGNSGEDLIFGGSGRDRLHGGKNADQLFGGNGRDRLFGGAGTDLLDGGARNDRLFGGKHNDVIAGRAGDDEIECGSGNDTADGGPDIDAATADCEVTANVP